jgi:hypothetical protein
MHVHTDTGHTVTHGRRADRQEGSVHGMGLGGLPLKQSIDGRASGAGAAFCFLVTPFVL